MLDVGKKARISTYGRGDDEWAIDTTIIHGSQALDLSVDADGNPYIVTVDGIYLYKPEGMILLDRHWKELIAAGLVRNASADSQKTKVHAYHSARNPDAALGSIIACASFGVTSCGYDFRLKNEVKVLRRKVACYDPKAMTDDDWTTLEVHADANGTFVFLPENSFALGVTEEWFHIPRNAVVQCTGKSTLARAGIIVTITPWEPAWRGHVTIEISNTSHVPVKLYLGEGVGQAIMTVTGGYGPNISYADKGGKYQDQAATITHSTYDRVG